MKKALVELLTSKRFIVLVSSVIGLIFARMNLGLESYVVDELAGQIATIAAVFIGGLSLSDAAKALTMPAGVDHKGRE
jgi:hypothetical protein